MVDPRTIQKYQRESKERNREGWYLSYVFDLTDEERSKGKTVEVGRAVLELEKTRFTILDAPGHKSFVPNMIAGAAQADIGVLIVSARKGEYEAGFDRSGQTREHALLCKTLGVEKMIVAINKMDEPTCNWSQDRFNHICTGVGQYLKSIGFPEKDVIYVPISGLTGANIKNHVSVKDQKIEDNGLEVDPYNDLGSWYTPDQPTLINILDNLYPKLTPRKPEAPVRIPVLESYKDQGVMAVGKVEMGTIKPGQKLIAVPMQKTCQVEKVLISGGVEGKYIDRYNHHHHAL